MLVQHLGREPRVVSALTALPETWRTPPTRKSRHYPPSAPNRYGTQRSPTKSEPNTDSMRLIAGNASRKLAISMAAGLRSELVGRDLERFPEG